MATIGELAEQVAELVRKKKDAASSEATYKKELDKLSEELLEKMTDDGIQNIKTASGMTLYKRCDKYYGVADGYEKEELVEALANCDLTRDIVQANYNAITLRSRMTEIALHGTELPDELKKMLKVTEVYKVGHNS